MLIEKVDETKLTPMMQQYLKIKKEYKDIIIFYRLGDFYEMFFDDALLASKELELVLTGRDAGLDEKVPMAGVPHHSANSYINRLVDKGYRVGIVEQMEDPSAAKGIVKRSIVKIISPGTVLDLEGKEKYNNFLLSIYLANNSFGISYIDISTGEFYTTEILNSNNLERDLLDLVVKVNPREIILNEKIESKIISNYIETKNIYISYTDIEKFDIKENIKNISNKVKNFSQREYKDKLFSVMASSILLDYIYLFREDNLNHIDNIEYINIDEFMKIDANTRENLEIHKNINENSRKNTLLEVLDYADTPMGSRKINSWLEFPLINIDKINQRLDLVEYFTKDISKSHEISNILNQVYDLERILSKISYKTANPKDLILFKNSLENLNDFKSALKNSKYSRLREISEKFDSLDDLYTLINDSIIEDAPNVITEGGIIKDGFNEKLDKLKYDSKHGKELLLEYEINERKRTNIPKLKISYNRNVGYFIEITNSYLNRVPEEYIRRQTLKNCERFITPYLNEVSDLILGGQTDIINFEYELFIKIRENISNNSDRIKNTTDIISTIDAVNSFAKVAINNNYCRPIFNEKNYFSINEGRHPVVEIAIDSNQFISNDTNIGEENNIIQIITGPNMAGKSTYMRQVALIVLMAQIGSFVPAKYCDISISDAIFTRIGASDNLSKGDSTFMVEMKEMSNIIKNATENSFIILDEVGRGTGTNDGYSIAKSIIEYISKKIKAKTLFATHYHELTDISDKYDNIENLKVDIKEENDNIVFLRKIVKGKTDKSYGIEVAKLSGLPDEIIFRANSILQSLDDEKLSNFSTDDSLKEELLKKNNENIKKDILIKELIDINIDTLTPIKALELLNNFKIKAEGIND